MFHSHRQLEQKNHSLDTSTGNNRPVWMWMVIVRCVSVCGCGWVIVRCVSVCGCGWVIVRCVCVWMWMGNSEVCECEWIESEVVSGCRCGWVIVRCVSVSG